MFVSHIIHRAIILLNSNTHPMLFKFPVLADCEPLDLLPPPSHHFPANNIEFSMPTKGTSDSTASTPPANPPPSPMPSPITIEALFDAAEQRATVIEAEFPDRGTVPVPDITIQDLTATLQECTTLTDTVDAVITFIVTTSARCSAKKPLRKALVAAGEYLRAYHNQAPLGCETHKDKDSSDHVLPTASVSRAQSPPNEEGALSDHSSIAKTLHYMQLQLAAVQATVVTIRDNTASYAAVAARPPQRTTVTQPKQPPPRSNPHNPSVDIIIDIAKTKAQDPVRSLKDHALKTHLEQALAQVEATANTPIHGVNTTARGAILLRARNPADAARIRQHSDKWIPHVAPQAQVHKKQYRVEVRSVPLTFNTKGSAPKEALYNENPSTFGSPGHIVDLQWKNHKRAKSSNKTHSSLILTVDDGHIADTLIYQSLTISGSLRTVTKYIPSPIQCYYCQALDSHIHKACPHKNDPAKLTCPRCARNHPLEECQCPAATPCSNPSQCTHIPLKCANCGGAHKAFSSQCPEKQAAIQRLQAQYDAGSRFYDPDFEQQMRTTTPR